MADETAAKQLKPKKARKPKPELTPEQIAKRQALKSWTSWKLDVQRAIMADKRIVAPSNRLLLIYLLHQMSQENGLAIVYDTKIMDEVVGFAVDTTIWRARTRLKELGWLLYIPGRGLEATRYWVLDKNVKGVFSLLDRLSDDRSVAQERRKAARKAGIETLHSQHKAMKAERRNPQVGSLQLATQSDAVDAGLSPSLPPSGIGQKATGRRQDLELRLADLMPPTEVVSCRDCGTMSEAGELAGGRCAECESEAMRAELLRLKLPRSKSGEFTCFDCGVETRTVARHKSEAYFPFCPDCIETYEFPDVKPIPPPPPPRDDELIAANDPGTDYKRVRDGN
jgi:hypothetical protein